MGAVEREGWDLDVEALGANYFDDDLFDIAGIKIEAERRQRGAQLGQIQSARADQAHLLLDEKDERDRPMLSFAGQQLPRDQEQERATAAVIRAQRLARRSALDDPSRRCDGQSRSSVDE